MLIEGQHLGEFEILEHLGQGGMGAVFKARQTSLGRLVALKTLKPFVSDDPEYVARFRQEAIAAAGLSHPNLVQVYAAGEAEGIHYFAMEYIEGESAQARLERKGRLDPLEAIALASHVAAALDYDWRKAQLIHRDIKPDNIFLSSDGEVKLGDLGLAKNAGQTMGLTVSGAMMGTPHYISPEQAQGQKDLDLRADIYSLGCTLYHLLGGQPPYTADSAMAVMLQHVNSPVPGLRAVWPECPEELAAVVMKMMLKPPASRYQSHAEVGAALRRVYDVLSGASVPDLVAVTQPQVAGVPRRAARPVSQKPRGPLYAGIGFGVAALVAAFVFFPSQPKSGGRGSPPAKPAPSATPARETAHPPSAEATAFLAAATKDMPFVNTLAMKFVPVPILSGPTANQRVLFGVWDVRVEDYAAYAKAQESAGKPVDGNWKMQNKDGVPCGRELDHPVVGVSWEDAQAFCQWLTEKEITEGKLPKGVKYRLPSDEEWSWAVGLPPEMGATPEEKHGKNGVDFPWGKDWPPTRKVGNYADETFHAKFPVKRNEKENRDENLWIEGYTDGFATTSPVGSFPVNAYGLYDMGGNVWQWCEDRWNAELKDRVLRGASFGRSNRGLLLSSYRHRSPATDRNGHHGFRCVMGLR
jgi:formylglycine-generating enzyme required for sulfatase activity